MATLAKHNFMISPQLWELYGQLKLWDEIGMMGGTRLRLGKFWQIIYSTYPILFLRNSVNLTKNFAANEARQHAPRGPIFFSIVEGGKLSILDFFLLVSMCSHQVPIKFLVCSQHVPQIPSLFLNMFSLTLHFIPYYLA
jgi:hypothetical protein